MRTPTTVLELKRRFQARGIRACVTMLREEIADLERDQADPATELLELVEPLRALRKLEELAVYLLSLVPAVLAPVGGLDVPQSDGEASWRLSALARLVRAYLSAQRATSCPRAGDDVAFAYNQRARLESELAVFVGFRDSGDPYPGRVDNYPSVDA